MLVVLMSGRKSNLQCVYNVIFGKIYSMRYAWNANVDRNTLAFKIRRRNV